MQVVILYESLTGNTERAARLIANAFYDRQVGAHVFPVDGYDAEALADADLVVAGTWTDGFFVVGQKPGRRKKFTGLARPGGQALRGVLHLRPRLGPHPRQASARSSTERGAEVIGGLAIRRDRLEAGAADFVGRVLDVVSA